MKFKDFSRAAEIRNYIVAKLTPGSARRLLTQISACCKSAVSSGLIKENPFMGMSEEIKVTYKDTDTIDPFNAAQTDAILSAFFAHPRYNHY